MIKPAITFAVLALIIQTDEAVQYIGTATMSEDRTITLHLRRTTDGKFVDAALTYRIGDPHYDEVLHHLGGLEPGETKLVPAWP